MIFHTHYALRLSEAGSNREQDVFSETYQKDNDEAAKAKEIESPGFDRATRRKVA